MKLWMCSILVLAGCTSAQTPEQTTPPDAAQIEMSFTRAQSLYDAPFPSDDLRKADGTIDVSKVPNPNHVGLIDQALALLSRDARGFALAGAIYFRASAPLDPASLPDMKASISAGASVFLVGIDKEKPDFLHRYPIDIAFMTDGGPLGADNLLAVLPLQGAPLRPNTRYAAVVTRAVRGADKQALARSPALDAIAGGQTPGGMTADVLAEYSGALSALGPLVHPEDVAALAVFTTDDPTAAMAVVENDAIASHPVSALEAPPTAGEVFTDYCVYNSKVTVPVYQSGTPPYSDVGGDWLFDSSGHPLFNHTESARVVITVPRGPTPAGGWPTVVFVRTGGGGDRPLVDRGTCATQDFTVPITPGTGPAMYFAQAGFAGIQIDGPLGGARNTTNDDEQFLIFNVNNAAALRDNVRQSALELALFSRTMKAISFDTSACPGAGPSAFHIDDKHVAIMGHSMGGWIAPLVLASEPTYGAGVLSGAGGSYIANVMDKKKPLDVRPLAEVLLGYTLIKRKLDAHDPALTIVQWAAEPSDPQVYDRVIVREPANGEAPRQVLMLQGIVDHYIMPSIANATSLAMGLSEAGPAYDATNAEEQSFKQTPLATLLSFAGSVAVALPTAANVASADGAKATAVVVQHPGDAIEDGHEVVFQTDAPKHQYRCFLSSFAKGVPSVPIDAKADAPCP